MFLKILKRHNWTKSCISGTPDGDGIAGGGGLLFWLPGKSARRIAVGGFRPRWSLRDEEQAADSPPNSGARLSPATGGGWRDFGGRSSSGSREDGKGDRDYSGGGAKNWSSRSWR